MVDCNDEACHRLLVLEDQVRKHDADLYKGNGKPALTVRMALVEQTVESTERILAEEQAANKQFRSRVYQDLEALKERNAHEDGKESSTERERGIRIETRHFIGGLIAAFLTLVLGTGIIHWLHW